jgi:hypothetical protein
MRDDERELIEKLRKIEQLFARPGTAGEREAAGQASQRIRARLETLEQADPPIEYRFTLTDAWSRSLFLAIVRRHGLRPYRYYGQRRTTVMVRVGKAFVDRTLWPEFQQFQEVLHAHFQAVTSRVIAEALGETDRDVEIRETKALGG